MRCASLAATNGRSSTGTIMPSPGEYSSHDAPLCRGSHRQSSQCHGQQAHFLARFSATRWHCQAYFLSLSLLLVTQSTDQFRVEVWWRPLSNSPTSITISLQARRRGFHDWLSHVGERSLKLPLPCNDMADSEREPLFFSWPDMAETGTTL